MNEANVIRISELSTPADDLRTAVEFFDTYCRSRNLSERTVEYYDCCLLAFTRFMSGRYHDVTPSGVTARIVREFLLDQTSRNSASTACHCHTTLCVLFRYLVDDGFITTTPMKGVDKPKRQKTMIDTFTAEQVSDLLATCDNGFYGIRDRAMILIMLDSGLRVSELLGLTLDDVSWPEQTFRVMGKGGKERSVPFGGTVKSALSRYVSRREKLSTKSLFVNCYGEAISRYSVRELISRKGDKAGITGVRCSPHTLRHTCAVQFLRSGGDVFSLQRLLGHSTLEMTKRYCESLRALDVQNVHRRHSPADNMGLSVTTSARKRLR